MTMRDSTTVRYESHTTIDRPIGDVFARLADVDRYGSWMRRTGLFRRSGQTSDGPLGLGATYFDATRMGTFRGDVTAYEPPTRIEFRETLHGFGADLMEARPEYILEADQGRTIVHHLAEGELFGVVPPVRLRCATAAPCLPRAVFFAFDMLASERLFFAPV